jgi:hypothetical protein
MRARPASIPWSTGAVVLFSLSTLARPGIAQSASSSGSGRSGPRPLLDAAVEISLARSAAPAEVSDSATVYVLGNDGYVVAVRGSNGVSCYVSRSWQRSVEPHCHDEEGSKTILPMAMKRVELLHRGLPFDSVDRAIASGIADGTFRLPRRPAMSWMMSSEQKLISDSGQDAGSWRPHIMIYFPWMSAADLGLTGVPDPRHAMLVDAGKPTANITVVVPEFVTPKPGPSGGR